MEAERRPGSLPWIDYAGAALRHAMDGEGERAADAINALATTHGSMYVPRAMLAWVDVMLAEYGVDRRSDTITQFTLADFDSHDDIAEQEADPDIRWCRLFISARANNDRETATALLATASEGPDRFNECIAALLECCSRTILTIRKQRT